MLVKLIEIQSGIRGTAPSVRDIYINPRHIISVSADLIANETLISEVVKYGLDEGTSFSKITIQDGSSAKSITVAGSPTEIYKKIRTKQVLKG